MTISPHHMCKIAPVTALIAKSLLKPITMVGNGAFRASLLLNLTETLLKQPIPVEAGLKLLDL